MILVADVGGTKTLAGAYQGDRLVAERRYLNAGHPDFVSVLAAFLADEPALVGDIETASVAVAGPVADDAGSARLTNLPWPDITVEAVAHACGATRVLISNDFAAAAVGAVTSPPADLVTLQTGRPLSQAPRLVIGAGTGLGMAIVLPEANGWRVIPGEGGHTGFSPGNEEQLALWHHLRAQHTRPTWEHVVSGPGLAAIHKHLSGAGGAVDAGDIGSQALADAKSLAAQAVRLFVSCYGAVAGDMALAVLARGGVFLAGGIAGKIVPLMRGPEFLAAFCAKGSHADLTAAMPVHIATDPRLGLRGAAILAAEMCR